MHGTTEGVGGGQAVSAKLETTKVDGLVERPMYFREGATNVMGAPAAKKDWFFAEGYTGAGVSEWLVTLNPDTGPAEVTITYQRGDGAV